MWKAIIDGLVRLLYTWWKAEQSEANEWEAKARAGQVESMKNVRLVEHRIDAAAVLGTASNSVRAWNTKARGASPPGLVLLVALTLMCAGCFTKYVYIESAWPVVSMPDRPVLPEDPPTFTDREMMLVNYVGVLEKKLATYNTEALKHNVKHGYSDPEGADNVGEVRETRTP